MAEMVLGVFDTREAADRAVDRIRDARYEAKDISVVVRDQVVGDAGSTRGENVVGGAASGATAGGVIGGVAGLLIGVGAIILPGIGGVLIGGPLAAALGLTGAAATTVSGAATGALAGGILGALVGLGVPETEARLYEQRIREGAVLVAVPLIEKDSGVKDILTSEGATDIRVIKTP